MTAAGLPPQRITPPASPHKADQSYQKSEFLHGLDPKQKFLILWQEVALGTMKGRLQLDGVLVYLCH